jgi:hypothetical protein
VDFDHAVQLDGGKVGYGRVAFVPIQAVVRIQLVQAQHFRVARSLG